MDNLTWGLQITVLGMGLVFALLALLWALLRLVLWLDRPAADVQPVVAPPREAVSAAAVKADLDPELVAAILVATMTHRAVRRREAAPVMRSIWPGSQLHGSRWVGTGRSRQNQSWIRRDR